MWDSEKEVALDIDEIGFTYEREGEAPNMEGVADPNDDGSTGGKRREQPQQQQARQATRSQDCQSKDDRGFSEASAVDALDSDTY